MGTTVSAPQPMPIQPQPPLASALTMHPGVMHPGVIGQQYQSCPPGCVPAYRAEGFGSSGANWLLWLIIIIIVILVLYYAFRKPAMY